jgi:hypothetical protein
LDYATVSGLTMVGLMVGILLAAVGIMMMYLRSNRRTAKLLTWIGCVLALVCVVPFVWSSRLSNEHKYDHVIAEVTANYTNLVAITDVQPYGASVYKITFNVTVPGGVSQTGCVGLTTETLDGRKVIAGETLTAACATALATTKK